MKVCLARKRDLGHVSAIGGAVLPEAYRGMLRPGTVAALLATAYSPTALLRRWEDHPMFLVWIGDAPIAFADGFVEDDRIVLSAICTVAGHRKQGAGGLLLDQVCRLAERLPVTMDVLLGHRLAERFCEGHGFVPGETLEVAMFSERVLERRWYRGPVEEFAEDHLGASTVA